MNNEWQPMTTAPRDGTVILAYDENKHVFITWYSRSTYLEKMYPDAETRWSSDSCQDFGGWECPLGWIPLPEAPK